MTDPGLSAWNNRVIPITKRMEKYRRGPFRGRNDLIILSFDVATRSNRWNLSRSQREPCARFHALHLPNHLIGDNVMIELRSTAGAVVTNFNGRIMPLRD